MSQPCIGCGTTAPGARRRERCDHCYGEHRMREKLYGRWTTRFVDGEPVREHVRRLIASGMTQHAIAVEAGMNQSRIHDLLNGGRRMARHNADAILALEPLPAPEKSRERYDEVLVQRVIHGDYRPSMGALSIAERRAVMDHAVRHGWSYVTLAERLHCSTIAADRALVRHRKAA